MPYRDRRDAGRHLAKRLAAFAGRPDVLVLALPRGGVPVASEVAAVLGAPLDVFLVRKLGVPGQEELAMGAIASGGARVLVESVIRQLRIPYSVVQAASEREQRELERRARDYRSDRPEPAVAGRTIILVDDGIATGASVRAAIVALKALHPARIVVAVPVAAPETCRELADAVDEVICAAMPERFSAVGLWYEDFSPTTDDEVRALLAEAWRAHPLPTTPYLAAGTQEDAEPHIAP